MKKFSYILFGLLGLLMAATACEEPADENPVLQKPTKFELNTPVMSTQYIELTATSTIKLTCSQPDYGYAAAANYYAQIALSEDGFNNEATYKEINENPYTDCANIELVGEEVAIAICNLRGITTEEGYTDEPARKIYVRLRAEIPGDPETSSIVSNVVVLEQVKGYFALKLPGYIYLIGDCGGWTGPDAGNAASLAGWRLFEAADAIGSKVYTGTFQIEAGKATFRFYTELTGWDGGASVGAQVEDNPVVCEMEGGIYSGLAVAGKGSFQFPTWEGGLMKITVDLANANSYRVTMEAVTE